MENKKYKKYLKHYASDKFIYSLKLIYYTEVS